MSFLLNIIYQLIVSNIRSKHLYNIFQLKDSIKVKQINQLYDHICLSIILPDQYNTPKSMKDYFIESVLIVNGELVEESKSYYTSFTIKQLFYRIEFLQNEIVNYLQKKNNTNNNSIQFVYTCIIENYFHLFYIFPLFCIFLPNMYNHLFLLIGCSINYILRDRVNVAIDYHRKLFQLSIYSTRNISITYYLSGGIKDSISSLSESKKMEQYLIGQNMHYLSKEIILDEQPTNTAENFYSFQQNYLIHQMGNNLSNLTIVTSNYHIKRAKIFVQKLLYSSYPELSKQTNWIVSELYEPYMITNEEIYLQNIESDIQKLFILKNETICLF